MRFSYSGNFLALAVIFILSLFALKSLAFDGFYTSHDGENHTARIAQYYLAIKDGQFPPRFAGSFYNNLGSPIFVYIYPLPYILGTILHFTGLSFANTFKVLLSTGFVVSQMFTYLWLLELFKDKKAALIGALFYAWVPYRFLLIYVRGSLSELLAYTFVPLVFYSITRLYTKATFKWVFMTTLSLACLLLSQNLVAYITLPIFVIYTLILYFFKKSWDFLLKAAITAIWAFLISSFTYLPALLERNFIIFNSAFNNTFNSHFVCFGQLIHSPWGYGFDFPGCLNDGMSMQIGLVQILVFLIFILFFVYWLIKKIVIKNGSTSKEENSFFTLAIFFMVIFLISIFLMLQIDINLLIWEKLTLLHIIDIPWRFLGLTALSMSVMAAYLVKRFKSGLLFLLLVIFLVIANRNHTRINKSIDYTDQQFLTYTGTATEKSEFTPNYGVTKAEVIKNRIDLLSGEAEINNLYFNSKLISFAVNVSSNNVLIRINKYFFPGLVIKDNNQKLESSRFSLSVDSKMYGQKISEESKGLLNIRLEKGKHNILAEFGETKLRIFADYLSLFSLLLAIGLFIRYAKD